MASVEGICAKKNEEEHCYLYKIEGSCGRVYESELTGRWGKTFGSRNDWLKRRLFYRLENPCF